MPGRLREVRCARSSSLRLSPRDQSPAKLTNAVPAERVAARARDDVHDRAAGVGLAEAAANTDGDFLDADCVVDVRRHAAAARRANGHAVHGHATFVVGAAIRREERHRRRKRNAVVIHGQPGRGVEQPAYRTRGRNRVRELVVEHDLAAGTLDVNDRGLARHADRFLHGTDLHLDGNGDDLTARGARCSPATTVLNPVRMNVSLSVPARKSTMRYRPEPSVTAVLVFLNERRAGRFNRYTRQHAAGGVTHSTRQSRLGVGGRRKKQQDGKAHQALH